MIYKFSKENKINRQFYWWFGSYAIIMLLSVLVNLIGYGVTIHVLEKDIERNNQNAIAHIRNIYDEYFNNMRKEAFFLLTSSTVSQIAHSSEDRYERNQWVEMLASDMNMQNVNYLINYGVCRVIFKNIDLCIQSNLGVCNLNIAYRDSFEKVYESKDEWINSVFSVSGLKYEIVTLATGEKKVFIIYNVPTVQENVAIVAEISDTLLTRALSAADDSSEKILITDEDGNILFANEGGKEIMGISAERIRFDEMKKRNDYIFNYVKSEAGPLYYVRLISSEIQFRELRNVRWAFIGQYLICIFIVGALAFVFAVINNRRKQLLDNELRMQKEILQTAALRRLLLHKSKVTDYEYLEEYRIALQNRQFVVCLFEMFPKLVDTDVQNLNGDFYKEFQQYIINMFGRKFEGAKSFFCSLNDASVAVVSFDTLVDLQELREIMDDICAAIQEEMNIVVRCSISQMTSEFEKLHELYEQTLEVSAYRFLREGSTTLLYENIIEENFLPYYGLDNAENLISLLTAGKCDAAIDFVGRLFDQNSKISLNMFKVLILEIIIILIKATQKIDPNAVLNIDELFGTFLEFNSAAKIYTAKHAIFEYIRKLCDISVKNARSSMRNETTKYKKIAEYIEENCTDPNIDVNMLAETFQISRSWLSRKFHAEMGSVISEYIVKCRLGKAKELLKTDMTISQIIERTGFSSKAVFYQAFKKYENLSPNQYRELVRRAETTDGKQ